MQLYAGACSATRVRWDDGIAGVERGLKAVAVVADSHEAARAAVQAECEPSMPAAEGWQGHMYHVVRYDLEVESGLVAGIAGLLGLKGRE